ncbi:MAG: hypothetical protein KGI94_14065 [Paracoccaceae bacterium]|nr:hypothetical protein [Paracoccaceae bacterium]MDE3238525.1 hypothetical protein [Paracoccaceae bacterium]
MSQDSVNFMAMPPVCAACALAQSPSEGKARAAAVWMTLSGNGQFTKPGAVCHILERFRPYPIGMERMLNAPADRRPLKVNLVRAILFATVALVVLTGHRHMTSTAQNASIHLDP